jgi:hypothetical protein
VEYLWAYLKAGDSANFCALDLTDLSAHLSRRVRRMRTHRDVGWSFLKHSELYPSITSLREDHQRTDTGLNARFVFAEDEMSAGRSKHRRPFRLSSYRSPADPF